VPAKVSWRRISAGYAGVLVRLPPSRQRLLTIRGIVRRESGSFEKALLDFNAVIGKAEGRRGQRHAIDAAMAHAGMGKTYRKLGEAGLKQGRESEAMSYFAAACESLRESVAIFRQDSGEKALFSWELAYVLNALGEVEQLLGRHGAAEQCFEAAMVACPRFGKAKKNWLSVDLRLVYE
jgi:tetratricopeptide (TPR) repeat protein